MEDEIIQIEQVIEEVIEIIQPVIEEETEVIQQVIEIDSEMDVVTSVITVPDIIETVSDIIPSSDPNSTLLYNQEIIDKYILHYFTIISMDIKLYTDCTLNIEIHTDRGIVYRRVYMNSFYYKLWSDDSFPYRFIRKFIYEIYMDVAIMYSEEHTHTL